MGDTLGRFLTVDFERALQSLYTYARICVEVDISKGLLDQFIIKVGDFVWTQILDYENTAFCCRHCHQAGHLQNSFPTLADKKTKGNHTKSNSKKWTPCTPPPAADSTSSSSNDDGSDAESDLAPQTKNLSTDAPEHPPDTTITQKRSHDSTSSDSDKEAPLLENSNLQIVPAHTHQDGWVKVNKKKGKKLRVENSTNSG